MPWLDPDISALLVDPEMASEFAVTRTQQTVDDGGMAHGKVTNLFGLRGVVTPIGSASLQRLPDGARTGGAIDVITPFRLLAGDDDQFDADIVLWNGAQYTVTQTQDYSQFGAGFVQATCLLLPINGAEPSALDT